jgi:hypothetical protein
MFSRLGVFTSGRDHRRGGLLTKTETYDQNGTNYRTIRGVVDSLKVGDHLLHGHLHEKNDRDHLLHGHLIGKKGGEHHLHDVLGDGDHIPNDGRGGKESGNHDRHGDRIEG